MPLPVFGSASDCRVSSMVAASISQSNTKFLSVSLIKRNKFCHQEGQWVSSEDPPIDFLSGSERSLEAEPAAAQTETALRHHQLGRLGLTHTHTHNGPGVQSLQSGQSAELTRN